MSDPAFAQLVDSHYASLYRFALSLARNSADAGDLVQQTFFIWGTKGGSLRDITKAKTWLFTTLYREFLKQRRHDQRSSSLEELPPSERDIADDEITRVQTMDAAEVMSALQTVPETFRAPLTLFYLEDLSYQEIASTLDVPIGTVMSRLSRGKAHLRHALSTSSASAEVKVVPFPRSRSRP